jgi:hypothetical protein
MTVAIAADEFLGQGENDTTQQLIGNRLTEFPKSFGNGCQAFKPQAVVHLEAETKVLNFAQRLVSFHGCVLLSRPKKPRDLRLEVTNCFDSRGRSLYPTPSFFKLKVRKGCLCRYNAIQESSPAKSSGTK